MIYKIESSNPHSPVLGNSGFPKTTAHFRREADQLSQMGTSEDAAEGYFACIIRLVSDFCGWVASFFSWISGSSTVEKGLKDYEGSPASWKELQEVVGADFDKFLKTCFVKFFPSAKAVPMPKNEEEKLGLLLYILCAFEDRTDLLGIASETDYPHRIDFLLNTLKIRPSHRFLSLYSFGDQTLLHIAKSHKTLTLLLKAYAELVNMPDKGGNTPLHLLFKKRIDRNEDEEVADETILMARLLLDNGANINALNSSGATPLHEITGYDFAFNGFLNRPEIDHTIRDHAGRGATALSLFCADQPGSVTDYILIEQTLRTCFLKHDFSAFQHFSYDYDGKNYGIAEYAVLMGMTGLFEDLVKSGQIHNTADLLTLAEKIRSKELKSLINLPSDRDITKWSPLEAHWFKNFRDLYLRLKEEIGGVDILLKCYGDAPPSWEDLRYQVGDLKTFLTDQFKTVWRPQQSLLHDEKSPLVLLLYMLCFWENQEKSDSFSNPFLTVPFADYSSLAQTLTKVTNAPSQTFLNCYFDKGLLEVCHSDKTREVIEEFLKKTDKT